MFLVHCPNHAKSVLLGLSRIRGVANLPGGVIVVELECHDGARILHLTGKGAATAAVR